MGASPLLIELLVSGFSATCGVVCLGYLLIYLGCLLMWIVDVGNREPA